MIIATGTHWTAPSALPAALAEDQRCGLAFYDYPAEHWVHLRTTNPIESTFATVSPVFSSGTGAGAACLT